MTFPPIAFGTSPYRPDGTRVDVEPAVREALAAGHRLFDVAEMYGNERAVGRALRGSGAQVIGKLWRSNFRPEHVRPACEASLQRLGIDAFDLYLLHAPGAMQHVAPLEDVEDIGFDEFRRRASPGSMDDVPVSETWEAMRALVTTGLARRIGVSNFSREQLDALGDRPFANEIPAWPLDEEQPADIMLLGYAPLEIIAASAVQRIAAAHRRTPAQVVLRALIQRGIRPITFSIRPDRIRESMALDFELTPEEVSEIR